MYINKLLPLDADHSSSERKRHRAIPKKSSDRNTVEINGSQEKGASPRIKDPAIDGMSPAVEVSIQGSTYTDCGSIPRMNDTILIGLFEIKVMKVSRTRVELVQLKIISE